MNLNSTHYTRLGMTVIELRDVIQSIVFFMLVPRGLPCTAEGKAFGSFYEVFWLVSFRNLEWFLKGFLELIGLTYDSILI